MSVPTRTDLDSGTAAEHYQRWKRLAPLGLAAVGFGASLVGQSTILLIRAQAGKTFFLSSGGPCDLFRRNRL